MAIERCYGQMKRRFPLLANGLRFRKPTDSAKCIVAIATLHNVCKRNYDDDEFNGQDSLVNEDSLVDEAIAVESLCGREKRDNIARAL